MNNEECLFCKIAHGEINSYKIYEDESVIAFLDINPVSKGHTLVVPKKHAKNIFDMEEDDYLKLQSAVKKLSKEIVKKLGACGANIMQNNETCAGQVIMHPHIHIIPRYDSDGLEMWHGNPIEEKEAQAVLEKIKLD